VHVCLSERLSSDSSGVSQFILEMVLSSFITGDAFVGTVHMSD
jgi:hypothetical protein